MRDEGGNDITCTVTPNLFHFLFLMTVKQTEKAI